MANVPQLSGAYLAYSHKLKFLQMLGELGETAKVNLALYHPPNMNLATCLNMPTKQLPN